MKGYQLSGSAYAIDTVDEGLDWLGNGGVLYVWSDVPGALLHADIYMRGTGDVRVTLYDVFTHAVGSFHFTAAGHALGFARSYVVGSVL